MDQNTRERLSVVTETFQDVPVAVVGDFLLDEFTSGDITRVSREAPVLILRYENTDSRPGGAANTVANAAALGARVIPLGVLGIGPEGDRLLDLWPVNVETDRLLRLPVRLTRKVRILAGSFHSYRQQVVRMDYEYPLELTRGEEDEIADRFRRSLNEVRAVIVSDYSLGTVTSRLRKLLIQAANKAKVTLVVDSRDHPEAFFGATTATPNITEVETALRQKIGHDLRRLEALGERARSKWGLEALLVTRGKLGMSLFRNGEVFHIPPYGWQEAVDVTGAGDTVAAVYATALAVGTGYQDAALLANIAGGIVVMKKGTATVSAAELQEALRHA